MEKRTKGAWLINHTNRLHEVKYAYDFEDIELAGKCGVFLSNLAASEEQGYLNNEKVEAIAKVSNIKKTELETIKRKLQEAKLIDFAKNGGVSVMGVTTAAVLGHTSDIFENNNPSNFQQAAIDLSENISELPQEERIIQEKISDIHKLSQSETSSLFSQAEEIGFVDCEILRDEQKLYFNGNLFRREGAEKTSAVLSTLKPEERRRITEVDDILNTQGCVALESARKILKDNLLTRLQSIGMYDFNEVSNSTEAKIFITKPSAFSKYGNPFEEDALDLAKAFVASLYYGINFSKPGRGQIVMLEVLLKKLVKGVEVGPATAIGEDYKLLELKRVIQLRKDKTYPDRYYMKLLKKDIGELALQVLQFGDTTEGSLFQSKSISSSVSNYVGPEINRQITRKRQNPKSKEAVAEILRTFRI